MARKSFFYRLGVALITFIMVVTVVPMALAIASDAFRYGEGPFI